MDQTSKQRLFNRQNILWNECSSVSFLLLLKFLKDDVFMFENEFLN